MSIHQSMRESDFGTIHGAISGGFEDGEGFCVLGVEEEGGYCILERGAEGVSLVDGEFINWGGENE